MVAAPNRRDARKLLAIVVQQSASKAAILFWGYGLYHSFQWFWYPKDFSVHSVASVIGVHEQGHEHPLARELLRQV